MTDTNRGLGLDLADSSCEGGETLTIVIPTYNREKALATTLSTMQNQAFPARVNVLVIDNGSTDGTSDIISNQLRNSPWLSARRFEGNAGYAESFFRAIENTGSDYVLLLSDEDEVVSESLTRLFSFISNKRADFVSPQIYTDGRLYRGRWWSGRVRFEHLHDAAFYLSGLVFRTKVANFWLPRVRELSSTQSAARIYPQIVLAMLVATSGRALWFGEKVAVTRDQLDSEIDKEGLQPYYEFSSRLDQFQSWAEIYDECLTTQKNEVPFWKLLRIRHAGMKHASQLTNILVMHLSERGISHPKMLMSAFFWQPLWWFERKLLNVRVKSFLLIRRALRLPGFAG